MQLLIDLKVQAAFGAVMAVLLVVGVVAYRSVLASFESAERIEHTDEVLEHLANLRLRIENIENGYRDFALSGTDAFLERSRSNASLADDEQRTLQELAADNPRQQRRLSVVTDRFVSSAPLAKLLNVCRAGDAGLLIQGQHVAYHHLVNAMPVPEWRDRLRLAGFCVIEEVPIVTGAAGQAFILLDQLWHVQRERGEFGQQMFEWMQQTPRSASAMREIFGGLLTMSAESDDHAGVVLLARKV